MEAIVIFASVVVEITVRVTSLYILPAFTQEYTMCLHLHDSCHVVVWHRLDSLLLIFVIWGECGNTK